MIINILTDNGYININLQDNALTYNTHCGIQTVLKLRKCSLHCTQSGTIMMFWKNMHTTPGDAHPAQQVALANLFFKNNDSYYIIL